MKCRVAAVKRLPVLHHSAAYIFTTFGKTELTHTSYFENGISLIPVLGGVHSLANDTALYEET